MLFAHGADISCVSKYTKNIELIELRKNISLGKTEVSVERISVCYVIEKLMEHGIHCLPCSCTNDVKLMSK